MPWLDALARHWFNHGYKWTAQRRQGETWCQELFSYVFEEFLKQSIIPDTCLTISVDYIRRFPIFAHDSSIPWSRSVSFSFDRDDFGVVRECVNKRHLGRRFLILTTLNAHDAQLLRVMRSIGYTCFQATLLFPILDILLHPLPDIIKLNGIYNIFCNFKCLR